MKLQKVVFEDLQLEITRRCNLKCAHCAKGEAQNLDMSKEIMDRILEQTESIGTLRFTGGEPTLNTEGIEYFLEQIIERKIKLNKISIITNGVNLSDNFIAAMKYIYEYMTFDEEYGKFKIEIYVSKDQFHNKAVGTGHSPDDIVKNLQKEFLGMEQIKIGIHQVGEYPRRVGRATELEWTIPKHNLMKRKIEVKNRDEEPLCIYRSLYTLQHDKQYVIICPVCFTAKGTLTSIDMIDFPYDSIDRISKDTITDYSIIELIKRFNFGALPCEICNKQKVLDVERKIAEFIYNNFNNDENILKYSAYVKEMSEFNEKNKLFQNKTMDIPIGEIIDVYTKVFFYTYLPDVKNTSMDDFITDVYSEVNEYMSLMICEKNLETDSLDYMKKFFTLKFSNIINDFFLEDVVYWDWIKLNIEGTKNLLRRNIAYAKCFLDIYKRIPEKDIVNFGRLKKVAEVIIDSGETLLECDAWWMNYVNSAREYFKQSPDYSNAEITKEMLKNCDKVIKVEKLMLEMEEVKNRLGEIFEDE